MEYAGQLVKCGFLVVVDWVAPVCNPIIGGSRTVLYDQADRSELRERKTCCTSCIGAAEGAGPSTGTATPQPLPLG